VKPLPFTQIRRQLLESSVWEDENPWVRVLWVTILMIADEPGRDGAVDMTVRALAGRACMSEADTKIAVATLMAPDPKSRSKKCEGRRLILLDEDRQWGWEVVNWPEYQADRKRFSDALRKREERAFEKGISSDPVRERPFVSDSVQERPKKSPDKIRQDKKREDTHPAGFVEFWSKYPRKVGREASAAVWDKMTDVERDAAGVAVDAFAALWAARPREEITFCPHPRTWLNQKRWQDDGMLPVPPTPEEEAAEKERLYWVEKKRVADEEQKKANADFLRRLKEGTDAGAH
jgi:5-carboxymethyl-2-hydroxymuconate isomerase